MRLEYLSKLPDVEIIKNLLEQVTKLGKVDYTISLLEIKLEENI